MTVYIGIDPGYTGGLAVISDTRTFGTPMPTYNIEVKTKRGLAKRKRYDLPALRKFFERYTVHDSMVKYGITQCHVTLEEQFPMPMERENKAGKVFKQASVSTFSTGLGYGIFQGLLTGLDMNYITVHPKTWQVEFFKRDTEKTTKEQALTVCEKLFPDVNLMASERSTMPHSGMIDALLLAEYGRRKMEEKKNDTGI